MAGIELCPGRAVTSNIQSLPSWGLEPSGGDRELSHCGHAVMEEVVLWECGEGELK